MATITAGFQDAELRRPDAQGRINLGKEVSGKTYAVEHADNGDILLRPVMIFHEREVWLYRNPTALDLVKTGLAQSAAGQTHDLGSFEQFADDEDED